MAFTIGNDINILQSTDTAIVGAGAGNDTYILTSALLNANQKITISDTNGANKLHLVAGLSIVSSMATSTALKLTLNNGAEVTLLGASSFNFLLGGNPLTGENAVAQPYNSLLMDTLGYAEVPGAAPVTNTNPVVIGETKKTVVLPIATAAAGSTATVTATADEEVFSFDVVGAKAQTNNTQLVLEGFDVTKDTLRLDLPNATGVTTLAALNSAQGVTVQPDPLNGLTLVTFGADANGDLVSISLAGVTDASLVNVTIV